jgi:SAM-dependent methyltransferase
VLDISAAALTRAQARLGPAKTRVAWIEADVTAEWPVPQVDIWHDRALFHFLIESDDRACYVTHLKRAVKPGGSVVIATFALDGPERCSGLPVQCYSASTLGVEIGKDFELAKTAHERHHTPFGTEQSFCYSRFVRVAE